MKVAKAIFVDYATAANDGVVTFWDGHLRVSLVGVENHNDVAPVVTACIVLQTIGDDACRGVNVVTLMPLYVKVLLKPGTGRKVRPPANTYSGFTPSGAKKK